MNHRRCALLAAAMLLFAAHAAAEDPQPYLLKDIHPGTAGQYYPKLAAVGDTVFFFARDGVHGEELWKSDGTEAGTVMVKDINVGAYGTPYQQLIALDRLLLFSAWSPGGRALWRSDGTEAGTEVVWTSFGYPMSLFDWNGTLYFQGGELWTSDGTTAGTSMLAEINPGTRTSAPHGFTAMNGLLLFAASDLAHGQELWRTDGTAAGTALVRDINLGTTPWGGSSSTPRGLTHIDGTVFFTAQDGVHGYELWKSDGTEAGTVLVKDLKPESPVTEPMDFTASDGRLFFTVFHADFGNELWRSDGTEAGTVMVKDILPGPDSGCSGGLVDLGGTLLFSGTDPDHGTELWTTDGTEAGTEMVLDIAEGTAHSFPRPMIVVRDKLYFTADDGIHGRELWVTDGTAAGTRMVADIGPGPIHGVSTSSSVALAGDAIYFYATDLDHGWEIWALPVPPDDPATQLQSMVASAEVLIGDAQSILEQLGTIPLPPPHELVGDLIAAARPHGVSGGLSVAVRLLGDDRARNDRLAIPILRRFIRRVERRAGIPAAEAEAMIGAAQGIIDQLGTFPVPPPAPAGAIGDLIGHTQALVADAQRILDRLAVVPLPPPLVAERIGDLIAGAEPYGVQAGLAFAARLLEDSRPANDRFAIPMLRAFIRRVERQSEIPPAEADALVADAREIMEQIAVIPLPPPDPGDVGNIPIPPPMVVDLWTDMQALEADAQRILDRLAVVPLPPPVPLGEIEGLVAGAQALVADAQRILDRLAVVPLPPPAPAAMVADLIADAEPYGLGSGLTIAERLLEDSRERNDRLAVPMLRLFIRRVERQEAIPAEEAEALVADAQRILDRLAVVPLPPPEPGQ